jgi:hypothetical protein
MIPSTNFSTTAGSRTPTGSSASMSEATEMMRRQLDADLDHVLGE